MEHMGVDQFMAQRARMRGPGPNLSDPHRSAAGPNKELATLRNMRAQGMENAREDFEQHQMYKESQAERGPTQPGVHRETLGGHFETPEQTEGRLSTLSRITRQEMGAHPHRYDVTGGEQLKMFMTPHEIHGGWQPLDADREDVMAETYRTGSTWDPSTPSTAGSEWGELAHNKDKPSRPMFGPTPGGGWFNRTEGGNKWVSHEYTETDDQLWDRKLDEAQGYGQRTSGGSGVKLIGGKSSQWSESYHPAGTGHSESSVEERYHPAVEGTTLFESIRSTGVQSPVRLGRGEGMMGKPQIVGGHHRLAAQSALDSNQLMPVLHHTDIREARNPVTQTAFRYS